ncbi:MAG: glutathione peroxidase [Deltaproteobacteria bacterium]|nr:glutathione peroxidase [Deltaproteobacteria bacterium]
MIKLIALFCLMIANAQSLYDFKIPLTNGQTLELGSFRGKVVVLVNTATKCGFAGQLKELEQLRSMHETKDLVVIAIPTNDFGGQEPLSGETLKEYCTAKHGAKYYIADRMSINDPLFKFLTRESKVKLNSFPERILWNFEKFIFDKEGNLRFRFRSHQSPISGKFKKAVESLL